MGYLYMTSIHTRFLLLALDTALLILAGWLLLHSNPISGKAVDCSTLLLISRLKSSILEFSGLAQGRI
jgi:hypothetical protein